MNVYQNGSVLLQISLSALVIVLIYGLHRLMDGFEREDRELLMRQRYARRWSEQEWMTMLKNLSDSAYFSQLDAVSGLDGKQDSTSSIQAQDVCSRFLGRSVYSVEGEPALQRIPVEIVTREDTWR